MHKEFQLGNCVWGYETRGTGMKFDVGGGQDGGVNSPHDVGRSIPKCGLSWMSESFGISFCELYSALWVVSLREVWLASVPRKLCFPFYFCNIVYLLFHFRGLVYFSRFYVSCLQVAELPLCGSLVS